MKNKNLRAISFEIPVGKQNLPFFKTEQNDEYIIWSSLQIIAMHSSNYSWISLPD